MLGENLVGRNPIGTEIWMSASQPMITLILEDEPIRNFVVLHMLCMQPSQSKQIVSLGQGLALHLGL